MLSGGGYAQYAKVNRSHIILVPKEYDFTKAACVTEVWATAYQILHFVAKVEANDFVLVHAAASGVGTSLIQLAKVAGAKVIAVAS